VKKKNSILEETNANSRDGRHRDGHEQ